MQKEEGSQIPHDRWTRKGSRGLVLLRALLLVATFGAIAAALVGSTAGRIVYHLALLTANGSAFSIVFLTMTSYPYQNRPSVHESSRSNPTGRRRYSLLALMWFVWGAFHGLLLTHLPLAYSPYLSLPAAIIPVALGWVYFSYAVLHGRRRAQQPPFVVPAQDDASGTHETGIPTSSRRRRARWTAAAFLVVVMVSAMVVFFSLPESHFRNIFALALVFMSMLGATVIEKKMLGSAKNTEWDP